MRPLRDAVSKCIGSEGHLARVPGQTLGVQSPCLPWRPVYCAVLPVLLPYMSPLGAVLCKCQTRSSAVPWLGLQRLCVYLCKLPA